MIIVVSSFNYPLAKSNQNFSELNVWKARAIESPGYSLSSKIDELNTQSRSKRSQYEYATDTKPNVNKFSNIQQNYDDMDDEIREEKAFMFSLPPDDDDDYSQYSLMGANVYKTPITEFDIANSGQGDQIDMLMNAYSRSNVMNSIPMSDVTTSMGIGYSPNYDVYMANKNDNASGFYQSGNFPSANYPNARGQGPKLEKYYGSGTSQKYPHFPNDKYY